jgi:SAM-dependent methyltransferase
MGELDPVRVYEDTGRQHRELIESILPDDWSWRGRRTLDFGCGVGRLMRQFAPEAEEAEFWGCDLDQPSVAWLKDNMCPPFHAFESAEVAKLEQPDGFFDLIYAFSVYTHFTDNWAGWLLEHHRVLKDDGLLLVTFLGEGMMEPLTGQKWDEDRIGMNPLLHGYPWELGGPIALNSSWWIRAHWGRAFEILELWPHGGGDPPAGHGMVLMRKKAVELTVEDLKRPDPEDPREIAALQHHAEQLQDEVLRLRSFIESLDNGAPSLAEIQNSTSWRITAPLRSARGFLRRR